MRILALLAGLVAVVLLASAAPAATATAAATIPCQEATGVAPLVTDLDGCAFDGRHCEVWVSLWDFQRQKAVNACG